LPTANEACNERVTGHPLFHLSDRELEMILSAIDLLIVYMDREFNIVRVNRAFAEADGRDERFFSGQNYLRLYPDGEIEPIFRHVVTTGETYRVQGKSSRYLKRNQDRPSHWDLALIPVKTPREQVAYLILTLADMTDRVEAAGKVDRYVKELERSNRDLEEFAYIASHDLQEPLRKIQSFGELIRRRFPDSLDTDIGNYVKRMVDSAARMRTLIDSLLDYSRIGTRAKPLRDVDLSTAAREAISNLEDLINRTKARVEIDRLPAVQADYGQMVRLMQNLVENGLKFQKDGNVPSISIKTGPVSPPGAEDTETPSNPRFCEIRVTDNGIGFNEAHRERIFKPFQRLHGRDAYPGVGIGLAICRRIAERHGGNITGKSRPGTGSTFIVRLPCKHDSDEVPS